MLSRWRGHAGSRWRGHAGYSECVLCLCEKYCILLQGKDIPLELSMMNAIQAFWWKILGLTQDSMTRGLAIFAPCPLSSTFSYGHARHICWISLWNPHTGRGQFKSTFTLSGMQRNFGREIQWSILYPYLRKLFGLENPCHCFSNKI